MKSKIIFLIALLTLNVVSASVISYTFNDPEIDKPDNNIEIINADSLVLQVNTPSDRVFCRYSTQKNIPFNSMYDDFDEPLQTVHKETFTDLSDGVHSYYVRCRDINDLSNSSKGLGELEVIFATSTPISAKITMDSDLLNEGKYEVSLITTKIPSSTPTLSYSFDGIKYEPIALYGSDKNWQGYLIIPDNAGEKAGSFKFSAKDLEGRSGNKIISGGVFEVDTKAPKQISTINGVGEYGQVILDWFLPDEENHEKINIYRSKDPGIDYTDFYDSIDADEEEYIDTDVTKGSVYYYKVALEDEVGNTGSLSREIQVIPRTSNTAPSSTGLSTELISLVDAVILELELLGSDIESAKSDYNSLESSQKEALAQIGIQKQLSNAESELSALKREVENYKLQDINSEILNTRLSSSRIKASAIRKRVPESFEEIDKSSNDIQLTEEDIRKGILEYSPNMNPSQVNDNAKSTKKLAEEKELKVSSKSQSFDITYLDGGSEIKSLVVHSMPSALEKTQGVLFLLKFPASINEDSVDIKNIDYSEEGSGVYTFGADSKQISYTVDSQVSTETLNLIELSLIDISEESSQITGYFLYDLPGSGSIGIFFLLVVAGSLVGYLSIMKRKQEENSVSKFISKAKEIKSLQKQGAAEEASSLYESLQIDYMNLTQEEKSKVFKEVKQIASHKK